MNFSQALEALKTGAYVTRKGWNGKNMFLWLKPGTLIKEEWCHDPTLLKLARENGGTIEALPTICKKTADNKVLTGWNASQEDMMADDWRLYFDFDQETLPFDFNQDTRPGLASADDWDVPEEERVTSEDLKLIDKHERFNNKLASTTEKLHGLRREDVNAGEVIDELKKEFKMDSEYLETHKKHLTPEQEFEAKVQSVMTEILLLSPIHRKYAISSAKSELKRDADTPEKESILEENFKLLEDYIKNN